MFNGVIFHDLVWKFLKGIQKKQIFLCPSEEPHCWWPIARWWPCYPGLSSIHTSTKALVSLDTAPLAGSWCSYCEWWWWYDFPWLHRQGTEVGRGARLRATLEWGRVDRFWCICMWTCRGSLWGFLETPENGWKGIRLAIKQPVSHSVPKWVQRAVWSHLWMMIINAHTYICINHNQHFLTISQGEYQVSYFPTASTPTNCGWTKWC